MKIQNKQLPIFFFLLLLSALFWVLIVMSKNYTTTLHYQAYFVNIPENKLLIDDKKVDLYLQVIAPGFTILAHKLSFKNRLPLSLSNFIVKKKADKWNYYWLGKQSISQLQESLPTNMQLLHVQPNRIDVLLDEKTERVLPIQLKSDLSFKDLYRLKEPIAIDPSTIVIYGPKAVVEVFDVIYTKSISLNDIDSDKNGQIEIEPLNHSQINYSINQIDWSFKVEQFTEGKIKIPISVSNIPRGYEIKLFPQEVTVNYLVSLDKYELVKSQMFETEINFNSENKRLPIKLIRQPDFVENIKVNPSKVEYFLIKK